MQAKAHLVVNKASLVGQILTGQQRPGIAGACIIVWARHNVVRVRCRVPVLLLRHKGGAAGAHCSCRAGLAVIHCWVERVAA